MGARARWAVLGLGVSLLALNLAAQQTRPRYGPAEYNDFTAASSEQDPKLRVRNLDAFLEKYPDSALRPFVFQAYIQAYLASDWPKVLEYADKFLALDHALVEEVYKHPGESDEQAKERMTAVYYDIHFFRARAFLLSPPDKGPQAGAAAEKAAASARQGLELLEKLSRPPNLTPEKFVELKKTGTGLFDAVLGNVAYRNKDYDTAARHFQVVVDHNPNDAFYTERLALSYLQASKPQYLLGYWAWARAAALFPESQKKNTRDKLVRSLTAYQAYAEACPRRHVEAQADELIATAKTSVTPPAGWALPDAQQVSALRSELPIKRIFDDLKARSEQRQLVWVASCGLELPELTGDVLEVLDSGDNLVTLRLAVGEETTTTANVEVKVKAPPEAKNIKPATTIRFSGVLTDYQSDPFMLRLTEGKVNPEDIPKAETPAQRKKPRSSR